MTKPKETKHERFVRVAEKRTQKVLDGLRELSKCNHPAVYEYTYAELKKIFDTIDKEVQRTKDVFAGKYRFSLSENKE